MAEKIVWQEPSAYQKAIQDRDGLGPNYRKSFAFGALLSAVTLILLFIRHQPIEGNWPMTIALCLSFTPVVGWLLPWMLRQMGDKIVISGRGITRNTATAGGILMFVTQWEDVASAKYECVLVGERDFPALLVRHQRGTVECFVLSASVDRNLLRDVFASNGVVIDGSDR